MWGTLRGAGYPIAMFIFFVWHEEEQRTRRHFLPRMEELHLC
jgi:hypothetical protein